MQKNKTLHSNNKEESHKQQNKSKTTPKCSFIHCSLKIDQEKQQRLNENLFYKGILSVESEHNPIISQTKISPVYKTSQSFYPYNNKKLQYNSKILLNLQTNEKLSPNAGFSTTSSHKFKSPKERQKFNKQSFDKLNSTSHLEIWKQLSKSYKKNYHSHGKIENDIRIKSKQKEMKEKLFFVLQKEGVANQVIKSKNRKQEDTINKIVESFLSKYGKKYMNKANVNQQKQQNDLEKNIILPRSLSSFNEFSKSRIKYNQSLIKKGAKECFQLVKSQHHHYTKSPKSSKDNSILLLHKEPLESCIEQYFKPMRKEIEGRISTEPVVKQIIRIKSKKLTYRSIEHLQRIKRELFKQQSAEKEVCIKESRTTKDSGIYSNQKMLTTVSSTQKPQNRQSVKSNKPKLLFVKKAVNQPAKNIPLSEGIKRHVHLQKIPQLIHLNKAPSISVSPNFRQNHLRTPSKLRITPTSSVISFGDESVGDRLKVIENRQSFLNAW